MDKELTSIQGIPAIVWGPPSGRVYLFVHGKCASKEDAEALARIVVPKGYQVLSFDLPEHGERKEEGRLCNVQNGVEDLNTVMDLVRSKWPSVSLFANSLGAYLSLVAFRNFSFENCLFSSPILDMQRLIENMMGWFKVTAAELEAQGEIPTPIGEPLSWAYYRYVKAHPVEVWNSPTAILYPELDNLTELAVVEDFKRRFGAQIQIVPASEHYMHTEAELEILDRWMIEHV